jgi:acetate kinase
VIERIGLSDSIFTIHVNGEKLTDIRDIHNHEEAVNIMLDSFKEHEMIKDITDIQGTGHRVVHGGETFPKSVVVTDEVESQIEELSELAPLHNPANLMGIRGHSLMERSIKHCNVWDFW